jgi:ferredoxin-NADP reductase
MATVSGVRRPIQRSVELRLDVHDRIDHLPGQHYVVRLTAEDGYTAQRSYSVASAPGDPLVELFVERLDDGEVSTYLADVVEPGDELEVRGPIGGWFVWDGETPALLLAGGSGVVPFVSMLRHARAIGREDLLRLAVSARTLAALPYAEELAEAGALIALTREKHGIRPAGRLSADELIPLWEPGQTGYVCGSASFAEAATQLLETTGLPASSIRVERFGPSGTAA